MHPKSQCCSCPNALSAKAAARHKRSNLVDYNDGNRLTLRSGVMGVARSQFVVDQSIKESVYVVDQLIIDSVNSVSPVRYLLSRSVGAVGMGTFY